MDTERPIKDCLKLINRDMRLIALAKTPRVVTDEQAELLSVLDSMTDIATKQLRASREQSNYQEAHC